MHTFRRHAPLDVATYVAPPDGDRSGPPLTQGFVFTMIATVAAARCPPAVLEILAQIDPDAWYHGQLLESVLAELEASDPELPRYLGRNIYFMMRSQLEAAGIRSVTEVLESIQRLWLQATRGDGGAWRTLVGPKRAHLEAEQPYNCLFEEGTIVGLAEAFGARDVRVEHGPCMRRGAPFCVLEVRWEE